jgi:hypothetical protein
MSHHADELRWLSETDLVAIERWLHRHVVEAQEALMDARRTQNDWLAVKTESEFALAYRLRYAVTKLIEESRSE